MIRVLILLLFGLVCQPVLADPQDLGRKVYNFRCYFCHGYSGDSRTLAASFLNPPPRNFTQADAAALSVSAIEAALREGRPGTAMKSFTGVISDDEILAVARFVHDEFVLRKAENTRYHTVANGWPDHERFASAYPFARGEISLTRRDEDLSADQIAGKQLYLKACVSCHDRGAPESEDVAWDARPLSFPRNNFSLADPPRFDAVASASPYAKHDRPPKVAGLRPSERKGRRLFQQNCAFCHGADGSGKNWIGQFLEPHPRNLRDPGFMRDKTREQIAHSISEGLPGTSMPTWKNLLSERDIRALVDYVAKAFHPLPGWGKRTD